MRVSTVVLLLCGSAGIARADEAPKTIALADLGLHVVGAGLQRTVAPHVAIQGVVALYVPWTQNKNVFKLRDDGTDGDVRGAVVRLRAFGYLSEAPTGPWISPFVQGGIGAATRSGKAETGPVWAAGATIGYAWLIGRNVHLAVGAGAQYHVARMSGGRALPSFATVFPQIDLNLGYAFR